MDILKYLRWGDLIKVGLDAKILSRADDRADEKIKGGWGIKLLAWSVKHIDKIFPEAVNTPPEVWTGNFEPGWSYWYNTTLKAKVTSDSYIDNRNREMDNWANDNINDREEKIITKNHRILDDNFRKELLKAEAESIVAAGTKAAAAKYSK